MKNFEIKFFIRLLGQNVCQKVCKKDKMHSNIHYLGCRQWCCAQKKGAFICKNAESRYRTRIAVPHGFFVKTVWLLCKVRFPNDAGRAHSYHIFCWCVWHANQWAFAWCNVIVICMAVMLMLFYCCNVCKWGQVAGPNDELHGRSMDHFVCCWALTGRAQTDWECFSLLVLAIKWGLTNGTNDLMARVAAKNG